MEKGLFIYLIRTVLLSKFKAEIRMKWSGGELSSVKNGGQIQ